MTDTETGGTQNIGGFDQCEELFCSDRPEWLFTDSLGNQTPVCEEHAMEFPGDRLRPIFHGDGDE